MPEETRDEQVWEGDARDRRLTRRQLLGAGGAAMLAGLLPDFVVRSPAPTSAAGCATLTDIDHVIIFIQENRSFDHYFGSDRGVRGFADRTAPRQSNGLSDFYQPDPQNVSNPPAGYLLPFHLNTQTTNAACTHDIDHGWIVQHQSWDGGLMDGFVTLRLQPNGNDAVLTMGYYTRGDLPFYYAVADAFTICDNYFCSVIGPTDPNRLYTVSASIDPDGKNGGPLVQTLDVQRQSFYGTFTWTTMPQQLEQRGISWKVYSSPDSNLENNVLTYFRQHWNTPPTSPMFHNAFVPTYPADFVTDCAAGNLPQVSWVLAPLVDSEHPPAPSLFGENDLHTIMNAVTSNRSLWTRSVIFATYDENGGFFDHVAPVTAPAGTPGEYVTATPVADPNALGGISGPIGLGFRVPMLIISPFSRGGLVSSQRFDHTPVLRFLETRFGAEVPNLTAWRRGVVGDMTGALNFAAPSPWIPGLPSTVTPSAGTIAQCAVTLAGTTPYTVPNPQSFPSQEGGARRRPSGPC